MAINYEASFEEALNSPPSEESNQVFFAEPAPLTTKQRNALSDFDFAWVYYKNGKKYRKYPIHDRSHTINAMSRLNGQYNKGNIKPTTYRKIRARILQAYKKFGITPKTISAIDKKSRKSELPMAAEPGCGFSGNCMESKMAMTKAQKRQNALKNLRKAWKARGLKPTFESAAEPKPRAKKRTTKKSGKKLTKAQRAAISRRNLAKARKAKKSPAYVYEPAPRKRTKKVKSKAGTGASRARSMTAAQFKREEAKIQKQRQAKAAASKKAATAKKRAATRAKGKTSQRGKWPREIPIGQYRGKKEGNVIEIKRVYTKKNPDWSNGGVIAAGAGGLLLGVIGSDLADRFVATMAPQGADKALVGEPAMAAIRTKANAWRLGTSAVGTAIGIGGAYMAAKYDNDYLAVGFGGFGLAFGVKFLTQLVTDVAMPILFKVDTSTEDSISNRLYPDKQDYAGLSATNETDGTTAGVGRPRLFKLPQTRGIGPVAGKVGTAGCGGTGPAHSFLANVARRQMAGVNGACADGSCSSGACADGPCNDPTVPGYIPTDNGAGNGNKMPGNVPSNTQPFDPGLRGQMRKKEPTMPDVSMVKNSILDDYKLRMKTPSMLAGTGVGTAGVYGHLFKKAV